MKCPKCSGTTGYIISQVIRHYEEIGWDDEELHVGHELIGKKRKTATCIDCKRRLDVKKYGLRSI
jgi:hypothetical protein